MDVSMPGMGGVKATQIINETSPAIRILLLTLSTNPPNFFERALSRSVPLAMF